MDEQRRTRLREHGSTDADLLSRLTAEFLDTLTLAATAYPCDEGQSEAIGFTLWCYEKAGREPPDFGRFSEANS